MIQEGFINHVGIVTLIRLGRKSERTALPMVKPIDEWGFPKERFFKGLDVAKWYCRIDSIGDTFMQG